MFADFDELLAHRPPGVVKLAQRLRAAAHEAMPDLTERFYPHWEGLGLKHPTGGLLGTLFARDADVVVYLERGAALPDPHGLLTGAERLRQTRTLVFDPAAPAPAEPILVEYLDLALEHAVARGGRSRARAVTQTGRPGRRSCE